MTETKTAPVDDGAIARLDAAKARLGNICEVRGWTHRYMPQADRYWPMVIVRKPPRRVGLEFRSVYVRGVGETELKAYEAVLAKLDASETAT